jgi:ligand-binding sensor domain-containing protein
MSLPGSAGDPIEVLFEPTARLGEVNRTLELARVDDRDIAELQINSLLVDDVDVVWITLSEPVVEALPNETRVISFDGEQWRSLEPPFPIDRALAANEEHLWVSAFGALARFDGESWDLYGAQDGVPQSYVSSAALEPSGKLWVYSIGLLVGDSPNSEMTQIPPALSSFDGTQWSNREPNQFEPFDTGSIAFGSDGSLVVASSTAQWGSSQPGGIWALGMETARQL